MKTIKYLLWLILLGVLGVLIYQNLDYFMTKTALNLDLKVSAWHWTIPELPNIAYFGICFLLGLILAGIKGLISKFRLKKEIRTKEAAIASLNEQINTLKIDLDVFRHDPYIKKKLEEPLILDAPVQAPPAKDTKEGDPLDTAD